jgi:hypothetical protein
MVTSLGVPMNLRDLKTFLIIQLIAIAIAGLSFKLIDSRLLAGAVAGFYFVTSGLFMVLRAWRWGDKWASAMWYPLLIHVFVISIPMVIARFLQARLGFEEVRIWGLPGPVFHRLSSSVFMLLLLATVFDWIRVYRRTRKPA